MILPGHLDGFNLDAHSLRIGASPTELLTNKPLRGMLLRATLSELAHCEELSLNAASQDARKAIDRGIVSVQRGLELARERSCMEWNGERIAALHASLLGLRKSAFRTAPVWFGGPTPDTAFQFGPESTLLPELVDDLCAFLNSERSHSAAGAAVAHYQIVMTHAFTDGNGRLARTVASSLLERLGMPAEGLLPVFALMRVWQSRFERARALVHSGSLTEYFGWWQSALAVADRFVDELNALTTMALHSLAAELNSREAAERLLCLGMKSAVVSEESLRKSFKCGADSARRQMSALSRNGWSDVPRSGREAASLYPRQLLQQARSALLAAAGGDGVAPNSAGEAPEAG
jgi:Fic family protein